MYINSKCNQLNCTKEVRKWLSDTAFNYKRNRWQTHAPGMAGLEICGWHIVLDGDGDVVVAQCCWRCRWRLRADMTCWVLARRRVCHRADIWEQRKKSASGCCVSPSFYRAIYVEGLMADGEGERDCVEVKGMDGTWNVEAAIFTRA